MTVSDFTSDSRARTRTITVHAPLCDAFPLFGPIRERAWATGWEPHLLSAPSDRVEEHMVFTTPSHPDHDEPDYTWILSKYLPEQALIE